jgi:hypothetical protein
MNEARMIGLPPTKLYQKEKYPAQIIGLNARIVADGCFPIPPAHTMKPKHHDLKTSHK